MDLFPIKRLQKRLGNLASFLNNRTLDLKDNIQYLPMPRSPDCQGCGSLGQPSEPFQHDRPPRSVLSLLPEVFLDPLNREKQIDFQISLENRANP